MRKRLWVTTSWDDGQRTDIKLAKLLTKYNIKGTFYITKSYSDSLEKHDVIKIDKEFEIGAHTLKHSILTKISTVQAREEIEGSKAFVEELLNHEITMFCYPGGFYNNQIKNMVKDAGFIGARTTNAGDFHFPEDPFQWHITLHASNGSPRMTFKIWRRNRLPIKTLIDWEIRSKFLFDLALEKGGIYHLWGHSWEIEKNKEWDKLERVLKYISNKNDVKYTTNSQIFVQSVGV
jgi:peptidoglycan/xylan/chitin deacetylase (PgdA/CDA1 family)